MKDLKREKPKEGNWISTSIFLIALGSLGPANIYFALSDPSYFERFDGWKIVFLPFGAWLLTGFLLQGITVAIAGFKGQADWLQRGEHAWDWWQKLGLWLLGIGIAFLVAILIFSGLSNFISGLDQGTLLIAGLLLLILLALWRIGDQMKSK